MKRMSLPRDLSWLVTLAMLFVLIVPLVAWADETVVLDSTITQDPGNTGGDEATVTVDGKTITFGGTIAYYEAGDDGFPPVAGNYVGVEVTAPTTITLGTSTTLTIGDKTYTGWDSFKDRENFFWYYPRVTEAGQEFTFVVKWDGTDATADTFTIKIADDAILEPAPPVPVVRDAGSVTQDPGQTGGDLTYVFNPESNTLIISGGEVPYIEAAEDGFPPLSGNWVGVAIEAPEGFSGDIQLLTIDGTVYTQPILSAQEQALGELWYYFLATEKDATHTLVIDWSDAYLEEIIIIQTSGLTLEPAPVGDVQKLREWWWQGHPVSASVPEPNENGLTVTSPGDPGTEDPAADAEGERAVTQKRAGGEKSGVEVD